jgi:hypothetical protein
MTNRYEPSRRHGEPRGKRRIAIIPPGPIIKSKTLGYRVKEPPKRSPTAIADAFKGALEKKKENL